MFFIGEIILIFKFESNKNLFIFRRDVVFRYFLMDKFEDNLGIWSILKYRYIWSNLFFKIVKYSFYILINLLYMFKLLIKWLLLRK